MGGQLFLVQQIRLSDGTDGKAEYRRIQPEDFPWVATSVPWIRYWIEWRRTDNGEAINDPRS